MEQLIDDPLTTPGGHTWGPCGNLVVPDYVVGMADGLQNMMGDVEQYERFSVNARGRVSDFFQLEDAMGAYNRLYRELGGLPVAELDDVAAATHDPQAAMAEVQPVPETVFEPSVAFEPLVVDTRGRRG